MLICSVHNRVFQSGCSFKSRNRHKLRQSPAIDIRLSVVMHFFDGIFIYTMVTKKIMIFNPPANTKN